MRISFQGALPGPQSEYQRQIPSCLQQWGGKKEQNTAEHSAFLHKGLTSDETL